MSRFGLTLAHMASRTLFLSFALLLGAGIFAPLQSQLNVALICANVTCPDVNLDVPLRNHLATTLGHTVTNFDDNDQTWTPTLYDVVAISESAGSSNNAWLKAQAVGIFFVEGSNWDELEIGTGGDATGGGDTQINITDNSHYITSVFPTGVRTVTTVATNLGQISGWANGVTKLAHYNSSPTLAKLAYVDNGGVLNGGVNIAAERRAFFGAQYFANLTADGITLFNRAFDWAAYNTASPATLLARYWMEEAASGQAPTQLLDDQTSPLNLPITYDGANYSYTAPATGRGWTSTTTNNQGRATTLVDGTKIQTTLNGATAASIEVVLAIDALSTSSIRIFHIGDASDSGYFTLSSPNATTLYFYSLGTTLRGQWNPGFDGTRAVFHLVYDSSEPTAGDRVRLYKNGTLLTSTGGTAPPLNETLSIPNGKYFAIANRELCCRSFDGAIYYAAVYDGALTAAEASTKATALLVLDDSSTDFVAPDAVTDLAAGNMTGSSVDLSWTAPGDDGATGTATSYDVRYSTSTITEGNWASATQATGEPAPQVAGSSESFTVTGLSPSTTYFFAIKTSDEIPNESAISNVPSVATAACAVGWVCWDGEGATNNWSEDANWTGDVEPVSTDLVAFNATSTKDATVNVASTVAALTIDSGYGSGTLTLGANLTSDGDFIQNGGTLDLSGQTFTQTGSAWTYTAGTTPTDGTVVFDDSNNGTITVTGSHSLGNVTVNADNGTLNLVIATRTTLTVNGTYTHSGNDRIDIEDGDIHLKGDITLANTDNDGRGDGTLTINGAGTQNLTGASAHRDSQLGNVVVDKATGTLNLSNWINIRASWTYTQGTIVPGTSTVAFNHNTDITGTHTLGNVRFHSQGDRTQTITAGDSLTVTGTTTISGGGNDDLDLDGGDVLAQGDVVITNTGNGGGGTATITMNGAGAQALTGPGTAGDGKLPNLTVDKSSGSVTLTGHPTVAGTLTLTQGELAHDTGAANSLTVEGGTAVTVAAAGTWTNYSTFTSTITLGGSVSNAGSIDFDATLGTLRRRECDPAPLRRQPHAALVVGRRVLQPLRRRRAGPSGINRDHGDRRKRCGRQRGELDV